VTSRCVEIPGAADTGGPFIVGETLTIYQAAMVYSGRHPGGQFLDGEYGRASLREYESFLGKGARGGPRKHAWDIYCQLRRMVAAGEIKPTKAAYTRSDEIDPLDTLIATADVGKLAKARGESPEYLANWMRESPRKERLQPKREQAKQLILQRYGRAPSEQDVSLGKLYQDCLAGQGDFQLSKDTFRRARDEMLAEYTQSQD
jgi:hypothetical protein